MKNQKISQLCGVSGAILGCGLLIKHFCPNMIEEVWRHALNYLDTYRSGQHQNDIGPLYELEDETGVLGKHKDKLLTPFSEHQVDMKIMYYELIKMLMDHDRDQMSEEEFSVTKTVHKIEGYQQLTNKLQRYMNLKFEGAITDITQKYDKIMNSIGNTNIMLKFEEMENNYLLLQQENHKLAERINVLDTSSSKFSEEYRNNIEMKLSDLSGTKERLEKTIEMIGDNKNTLNQLIEKTNRHEDDLTSLKSTKTVDEKSVNLLIQGLRTDVDEKISVESKKTSENFDSIQIRLDKNKQDVEAELKIIKDVAEKTDDSMRNANEEILKLENSLKELKKDVHDVTDDCSKNTDRIDTLEHIVDGLESRSTETVERMKDVTVLAGQIKLDVSNLEKKMEEEGKQTFEKINSNINELNDISSELEKIRNTILQQQTNINISLKSMGDNVDGSKNSLNQKLSEQNEIYNSRLSELQNGFDEARNKIILLEEGHSLSVTKFEMMETLGSRLSTVEDTRQMSDAMRDEVDKNRNDLETSKADMENRINDMMGKMDSITKSLSEHKDSINIEIKEIKNQNNEANQQIMERSEELRTSVYKEISTSVQERFSQVQVLVKEIETKNNDVGQMIKEDQRQELKSIEGQLNTIYQEYEKMEKLLDEMKTKQKEDYKSLSESEKNNADNIADTDKKMIAIMEQTNTLMLKDATQNDAIEKLDTRVTKIETRFDSLEEADKFLQESQRQITEKTTVIESNVQVNTDDLEKKSAQLNNLKINVEKLEGKQENCINEVASLTTQLSVLEEKVEDLEKKMDTELDSIKSMNNERTTQFESFQQEVYRDIENLRNAEESLDSGFKSMLDTSKTDFKEDLDQLRIELDFKTQNLQNVSVLHSEIDDLTKNRKMLEEELSAKLNELANKLNDLENHKVLTIKRMDDVDNYTQGVNTKLEEMQQSLENQIAVASKDYKDQFSKIENSLSTEITEKITSINESIVTVNTSSTEATEKIKLDLEEKLFELISVDNETMEKIENLTEQLKKTDKLAGEAKNKCDVFQQENTLIVERVDVQQNSLDKIFSDLENFSKNQDSLFADRDNLLKGIQGGFESKLGALHNEVNSLDVRIKNNHSLSEKQQKISDGLETLTIEMFTVFNGSTLLLKSDGLLAKSQPQLMGVYRLVDSYNDRPVFKQDMGENYIYYSSGSSSWLVGCRVGHRYSWLRNTCSAAAGARWPQLLRSGWEVRSASGDQASWDEDNITLENIRDVDKIREIIRDLKTRIL